MIEKVRHVCVVRGNKQSMVCESKIFFFGLFFNGHLNIQVRCRFSSEKGGFDETKSTRRGTLAPLN